VTYDENRNPGAVRAAAGADERYQSEGKNTRVGRSRQARVSRFFSAADLSGKAIPVREWVVPGLVPRSTVTLISGDGGTGKSLLMMQLAVAVCAARPWLGMSVAAGRAIFVSAEDEEDELHRRLSDILRAEDLDFGAVGGLTIRSLAGEDALLAVEGEAELLETDLFRELAAHTATAQPVLVLIDTAADVYPGDENFKAKVRQFIGILRGLALRSRCAVVLLSHPSLSGMASGTGTSGNTAWSNSVRSRLYLNRVVEDGQEADPDRRVLTVKKSNYGRTGGDVFVRYNDGSFQREAGGAHLDVGNAGGIGKADTVFLKLLRRFAEQGRRVNAAGGLSYAPKAFSEHPDAEGVTKRAFKAAMERCLATGMVKVATDGPASKRRTFLEVVE
jgi:RecA-family ATPase